MKFSYGHAQRENKTNHQMVPVLEPVEIEPADMSQANRSVAQNAPTVCLAAYISKTESKKLEKTGVRVDFSEKCTLTPVTKASCIVATDAARPTLASVFF
jgi:hypothetical protein